MLNFYNLNVIEINKIHQKSFDAKITEIDSLKKLINQAIRPFKFTCSSRRISIEIEEANDLKNGAKAAWETLNLILFNLI